MSRLSMVGLLALAALAGCGDDAQETDPDASPDSAVLPDEDASTPSEKDATVPGQKDAAAPHEDRDTGVMDHDAAAQDADAGSDAGERDAQLPAEEVELPEGSRELDGIVNLVDAPAADELEQFLIEQELVPFYERHSLLLSLNVFLTHYVEDYDFVFFVTDHEVTGGNAIGIFEPVTRPAMKGGTSEFEVQAPEYITTGRIKGVIALRYRPNILPPLAHETMHYWANDLDSTLGIGTEPDYSKHWGLSSVHGMLGGFDAATLRCETPAGALPPNCTALGGGRTRYVVGLFFGNDNTAFGIPYAPLELYLMGLIPGSDVPDAFQVLSGGVVDETSYDDVAETIVVEADGITEVSFDSIVARHREVEPLAEAERHFKAAFVVISAEPAPQDVLQEVALWAAVFGARTDVPGWSSFADDTLGLASMDTTLGARRTVDDPPPPPREPLRCDVLAQDCPRPELSCNQYFPPLCGLSAGLEQGEACAATFACAPGLECMRSNSNASAFYCEPYCDPEGTGEKACATLCPGQSINFQDQNGDTIAAACTPD